MNTLCDPIYFKKEAERYFHEYKRYTAKGTKRKQNFLSSTEPNEIVKSLRMVFALEIQCLGRVKRLSLKGKSSKILINALYLCRSFFFFIPLSIPFSNKKNGHVCVCVYRYL